MCEGFFVCLFAAKIKDFVNFFPTFSYAYDWRASMIPMRLIDLLVLYKSYAYDWPMLKIPICMIGVLV